MVVCFFCKDSKKIEEINNKLEEKLENQINVFCFCEKNAFIKFCQKGDVNIDILFFDTCFVEKDKRFRKYIELSEKISEIVYMSNNKEEAIHYFSKKTTAFLVNPFNNLKEIYNICKATHISNTKKIIINDILIDVNDIIYIEAQGSYSIIVLSSKKEILISKNLKKIETELNFLFLIRIHKSFIVNINYIDKWYYKYIVLKNNIKIPVGRNRSSILKLLLENNMK
ncbi:LytR/AlgR family response regulator transcription factor [Lachnobacterium bovis]|uniref:Two component transcriptional regulator, LytTR family n=1 Tax=Lachnobacterium bovis DSM 14045 TaxID=1122142 RepID=A0A1H3MXV6_9FIRM|nr:LytTR family DNA-binding domain-containing protein [Lachnobacterium bovis]SDY81055.1 two component transcriptional regulator, LytTR family [Lachnobacterium bovis DSM 14045]